MDIYSVICVCWKWIHTRTLALDSQTLNWSGSTLVIRYGVVANIAVFHTAATGSIPVIGSLFCFCLLCVSFAGLSSRSDCFTNSKR